MQVPAHVEYEKASSVEHALSLLARYGPEARAAVPLLLIVMLPLPDCSTSPPA